MRIITELGLHIVFWVVWYVIYSLLTDLLGLHEDTANLPFFYLYLPVAGLFSVGLILIYKAIRKPRHKKPSSMDAETK